MGIRGMGVRGNCKSFGGCTDVCAGGGGSVCSSGLAAKERCGMHRRWIGVVAWGAMLVGGVGVARGEAAAAGVDDGEMYAAMEVREVAGAEGGAGAVVKVPAVTAAAREMAVDATAVGPARVVVEGVGVASEGVSQGRRALIPEPEVVAVLSLLLGPLLIARQRERGRGVVPRREARVVGGGFE